MIESIKDSSAKTEENYSDFKKSNRTQQKLFVFDPNTVKNEELLALGFSEKTARIFLKYRSKGFVFKKKEDLKKVFGVSDNLYNKLLP